MQIFSLMIPFLAQSSTSKTELSGKKWMKMFYQSYNSSIKDFLCHTQQLTPIQCNKISKILW